MTTIETPAPLSVTEKREALLYNMLSHTTHFLKRFLKHQQRRNTPQSLEAAEDIKQELQLAQEWLHEFKCDTTMQDAFTALADEMEAQLMQEVKDLWDVWEWATSKERHWCDDVRLHLSGVHFEIAEPKEGKTKAERRPTIHRFTYYKHEETGLRGAVHEAAEWVRKQSDHE